ncbi:hypothetical protein [Streptomyces acidicola]
MREEGAGAQVAAVGEDDRPGALTPADLETALNNYLGQLLPGGTVPAGS